MEDALEGHKETISISGRTIVNLWFVDDIDGLAGKEEELLNLVKRLLCFPFLLCVNSIDNIILCGVNMTIVWLAQCFFQVSKSCSERKKTSQSIEGEREGRDRQTDRQRDHGKLLV